MSSSASTETPRAVLLERLQPNPLVSVIIANYNYARFLPDAVESVLRQSYSNFELLICDDGSTDDSSSVLKYLNKRDSRIRVFFKENEGQASAWNLAFQNSEGEIICILDADDWYRDDSVEQTVNAFQVQHNAGVVYHRLQAVSGSGVAVGSPFPADLPAGSLYQRALSQGGFVYYPGTTQSLRRELATLLFPLPVDLRNYGDTYIALVAPFLTEIAAIPEALTFYRQHEANHSGFRGAINPVALSNGVKSILTAAPHQKKFLATVLGDSVASRVSYRDIDWFWENLAAIYVLDDKPSDGVMGFSGQEIDQNLPRSRRGYLWKLMLRLPSFVYRRLLPIWRSDARWKYLLRPITGPVGS